MPPSFRQAPDFDRRTDIVEATLDCIADLGIQATTVRAVAARANISAGLIRHYFASKANLIAAAYRCTIEMVIRPALNTCALKEGAPQERLARFIVASLGESVADPRILSLWANFIHQVYRDPDLACEHREGYLVFRGAIETLIREALLAEGRPPSAQDCHHLAIAVNALIDGLWLEGCLSADEINGKLQISIGLSSVSALLGIALPPSPHLPRE